MEEKGDIKGVVPVNTSADILNTITNDPSITLATEKSSLIDRSKLRSDQINNKKTYNTGYVVILTMISAVGGFLFG